MEFQTKEDLGIFTKQQSSSVSRSGFQEGHEVKTRSFLKESSLSQQQKFIYLQESKLQSDEQVKIRHTIHLSANQAIKNQENCIVGSPFTSQLQANKPFANISVIDQQQQSSRKSRLEFEQNKQIKNDSTKEYTQQTFSGQFSEFQNQNHRNSRYHANQLSSIIGDVPRKSISDNNFVDSLEPTGITSLNELVNIKELDQLQSENKETFILERMRSYLQKDEVQTKVLSKSNWQNLQEKRQISNKFQIKTNSCQQNKNSFGLFMLRLQSQRSLKNDCLSTSNSSRVKQINLNNSCNRTRFNQPQINQPAGLELNKLATAKKQLNQLQEIARLKNHGSNQPNNILTPSIDHSIANQVPINDDLGQLSSKSNANQQQISQTLQNRVGKNKDCQQRSINENQLVKYHGVNNQQNKNEQTRVKKQVQLQIYQDQILPQLIKESNNKKISFELHLGSLQSGEMYNLLGDKFTQAFKTQSNFKQRDQISEGFVPVLAQLSQDAPHQFKEPSAF